jgi:hypothetical protein
MNIDALVPLTNGLSVTAGPHTLVCDRTRITPLNGDVEVSFWIAGTDYAPRFTLSRERIAADTPEELARIVRHVAAGAVLGRRPSRDP